MYMFVVPYHVAWSLHRMCAYLIMLHSFAYDIAHRLGVVFIESSLSSFSGLPFHNRNSKQFMRYCWCFLMRTNLCTFASVIS